MVTIAIKDFVSVVVSLHSANTNETKSCRRNQFYNTVLKNFGGL